MQIREVPSDEPNTVALEITIRRWRLWLELVKALVTGKLFGIEKNRP